MGRLQSAPRLNWHARWHVAVIQPDYCYTIFLLHISSRNHKLSEPSYSWGSVCRQVTVSTAAEPKHLLNPSSSLIIWVSSRSDASHPVLVTCWQHAWWQHACVSLKWPCSCWWWMMNRELGEHEVRSKSELLKCVWISKVKGMVQFKPLPRGAPLKEARWKKAAELTRLERQVWSASLD